MRKLMVIASLLVPSMLLAQQPSFESAVQSVVTTTTGYVLTAVSVMAVLFALVLGIRFAINLARRIVGR